jgi:sugar/nucleoside kinase (ribokinase family)
MEQGLKSVTWLKVDRAEAEFLTGESDLQQAARALSEMGPREIVLTQSSGVTVFVDGNFYSAPFTPRSLAGRTGRGDTCFSTYIAMRQQADPATACRWAGLITSQKQETPGPWKGNPDEIRELLPGFKSRLGVSFAKGHQSAFLRPCCVRTPEFPPCPEKIRNTGWFARE